MEEEGRGGEDKEEKELPTSMCLIGAQHCSVLSMEILIQCSLVTHFTDEKAETRRHH